MAANRITTQEPASKPSVAPNQASPKPETKRKGRQPLSDAEKEARKAALASETKDAKFRRLANHRVPRAVKAIKAIAHLANRSSYTWTQEQFDKIFDALDEALKIAIDRFQGNKDNGSSFSL